MSVLELINIEKSFAGTPVLKGISLTVEEGEVLAILGPSGSGKSTLLRTAAFLEPIDAGEIRYFGETAVRADAGGRYSGDLKQIRSGFGLVFQNFNLFPHWTVERSIMDAPLHVLKKPLDEVRRITAELIGKLNLTGREQAYPSQLSGGQQQRVAIARALALSPRLLFFDEPTSALDPELTGEVLQIIRRLAAEKMTMVIVTHEMAFAAEVGDRAVFMDGGEVIESGPARELIEQPSSARARMFLRKLQRLED